MASLHDTDLADKLAPEVNAGAPADESQPLSSSSFVSFGPFDLDIKRERLYQDGSRIPLAGNPMRVLLKLLERPNEIVTRSELRYLWPAAESAGQNTDMSLSSYVSKIRKALGDRMARPIYIETIEGVGYSFIGTIELSEKPSWASGRKRLPSTPIVDEAPDTRVVSRRSDSQARKVAYQRSILCFAIMTFIAATLLGSGLAFTWRVGINPRSVGGLFLLTMILGIAVCMTLAAIGLIFLAAPSLRRAG